MELFSLSKHSKVKHIEMEEPVETWVYFRNLVAEACREGNVDAIFKLQEDRLWNDLDEGDLGSLLDCVLVSTKGNVNREGKKAIFFLLTAHPNWEPTHQEDKLACLLEPVAISFEKEELPQFITAFLKIRNLEEISVGWLVEMTEIVLQLQQREIFGLLTRLPAWNKIPPFSYARLVSRCCSHLDKCVEEIASFLAHPCWNKLSTRDLMKIADPSNGEAMIILSKNEQWKNLSPQQLCYLGYHSFLSQTTVDLIVKHPSWNAISRDELADLATSAGNHYHDVHYALFLKITEHPRWEELRKEDLDEIRRFLFPCGKHRDAILRLITIHKNWEDQD